MPAQLTFIAILSAVAILLGILIIRSRRRGHANNEIYVGNLNYQTKEKELRRWFSQFGKINEIKVIKNKRTGRSKGYAFIRYAKADEATAALSHHGQQLESRTLVVRIAKSRARA